MFLCHVSNQDDTSCLASRRKANKSIIFMFLLLKNKRQDHDFLRILYSQCDVHILQYSSVIQIDNLFNIWSIQPSCCYCYRLWNLAFSWERLVKASALFLSNITLHEYKYKHIVHRIRNTQENLSSFWFPQMPVVLGYLSRNDWLCVMSLEIGPNLSIAKKLRNHDQELIFL